MTEEEEDVCSMGWGVGSCVCWVRVGCVVCGDGGGVGGDGLMRMRRKTGEYFWCLVVEG